MIQKEQNIIWGNHQDKITILNPKDFETPVFVKNLSKDFGLDIGTLGLINAEKIKYRLNTMKALMNEDTRRKIEDFLKFFGDNTCLPTTENEFLRQYEYKRLSYWEGVQKLINFLEQYPEVESFRNLAAELQSKMGFKEMEERMAAYILEKLKKVTFLEGVIKMKFQRKGSNYEYLDNNGLISGVVVGKKMYNSTWGSGFSAPIPEWMKTNFLKATRLTKIFQKFMNIRATMKANRSSVVTYTPMSIVRDIKNCMEENDTIRKYYNYIFTIKFEYSSAGLDLEFISVENKGWSRDFKFKHSNFEGLTTKEKIRIHKEVKKINEVYKFTSSVRNCQKVYEDLDAHCDLFKKNFTIKSPLTDEDFRWYALRNIYNEQKKLVENLEIIRKYTYEATKELDKLGDIVATMQKIAKQRNLSICIPEIIEDKKGTSFKDLAPIEIIEKSNELIPFNLPTINGHILCLTGRHGGGKSVAGKSILSSIFLAQSGLPVFAKEFKTEIKTVMGSVVNDEGEGSTATVFVEKVKNLLDGISKVPVGQSIVFIDEIGKGTQEAAGVSLGKRLLKTVKEKGYSVVFNSQILQLAEYAKDELGARCFVVDKNHNFQEGVGDGQMDELIKEKGLDKYLN